MLLSTQKTCLLAPGDTWNCSGLGMPVKSNFQGSPGYVPLVSMDLIWELLGRLVLELFIVQMRHVSALQLSILILFMPGVTMTSTDQLYKEGFLPIVNSLMHSLMGWQAEVWENNFSCSLISHSWPPRSLLNPHTFPLYRLGSNWWLWSLRNEE